MLETQRIQLTRPYYHKESKGLVYNQIPYGPWEMTQCHCVGEDL